MSTAKTDISRRIVGDGECKTSVIIPVYNTAEYLRECLDSVFSQTQDDFELICIDDGSTDGSLELLRDYEATHGNMTVLESGRARQGAARNIGLLHARGTYVFFCDSDDVMRPGLLQTCYEACEQSTLDMVTLDADPIIEPPLGPEVCDLPDKSGIDPSAVLSGPQFWERYASEGLIYGVVWMHYLRRDFLLENEAFFAENIFFEDNDWTVRIYMNAKRMSYIPGRLYAHRFRSGSTIMPSRHLDLLESSYTVFMRLACIFDSCADEAQLRVARGMLSMCVRRMPALGSSVAAVDAAPSTSAFCDDLRGLLTEDGHRDELRMYAVAMASRVSACYGGTRSALDDTIARVQDAAGTVVSRVLSYPELYDPDARVGLYGSGAIASTFMSLLRAYAGAPRADVTVLDSKRDSGTWEGLPVVRLQKANLASFDLIVVASTKYRSEMLDAVLTACPAVRVVAVPLCLRAAL